MDDYVCISHNKRKCPDVVCRGRAVRQGYVAPSTRKKVAPPVVEVAPDPELLWVATPVVRYGRDGEMRDSVAHFPGAPCGHPDAEKLEEETGLPPGWGRIVDPTAKRRLDNGERVPTTDGAELVAVGVCPTCAGQRK
ncbi:MAG TPA: hypothetical protein VMZ00_03345 [Sporichthya sp.]|nr:hypothetical protein [Sporichthya sp.]